MHARAGELHFFAYESKLRYVRDSPEGAVKYSRYPPSSAHAASTTVLRQQNAAAPTPTAKRHSHRIPRRTYQYYARCQWGNPNNCVMETTKCVFRMTVPSRLAFRNCRALINNFVDDLSLSLPPSSPTSFSLSFSIYLYLSTYLSVSCTYWCGLIKRNARTSKRKYLFNPRRDVISHRRNSPSRVAL